MVCTACTFSAAMRGVCVWGTWCIAMEKQLHLCTDSPHSTRQIGESICSVMLLLCLFCSRLPGGHAHSTRPLAETERRRLSKSSHGIGLSSNTLLPAIESSSDSSDSSMK
eukprot:scpid19788/ scgid10058/ 